ncbi:MAG: hypothetical protein R3E39_20140 [Anaerolineae bacterium]
MEDLYYATANSVSLEEIQICVKQVGLVSNLYSDREEQYLTINFDCVFEGKTYKDYWRFHKVTSDARLLDKINTGYHEQSKNLSAFNIQYRPSSIMCMMPFLRSLLTTYGGWVETMYSDKMYNVSSIDQIVMNIASEQRDKTGD